MVKKFLAVFLLVSLAAAGRFVVNDAQIAEVARMLAAATGKNLIVDQRVKGKISLYVEGNLTAEQVWDLFTVALTQLGYAIRYDNKTDTVWIVPVTQVRGLPAAQVKRYGGEFALGLLKLNYLSAKEVLPSVTPLVSFRGKAYAAGKHLLAVWDYKPNVDLIREVLKRIDAPAERKVVRVYGVKNATVEGFESALKTLSEALDAAGAGKIFYSKLPAENALVVVAPAALQEQIARLKERIETVPDADRPSFRAVELRFTSVEEVKEALEKLFADAKSGEGFKLPSGVRISFDRASNAVLIYGTERDYQTIKELIERLDRRRRQVLITATVVETSAKSVLDKGVNWQIFGKNGGVAFGALSREALYQAISQGQFVVGALSSTGTAVTVGGTELFFPDLLFLYSLLEEGSGFNIISNPKVLTLDNREATIKVGQEVPFPTGVKYDVNGNPIITYDYRYVGLELSVTPRVSSESLRLVIDLKVQEITAYLNNNVGGINYSVPVTSTRELTSDLVVENGQTVIIGGLIGDKNLKSVSKVPLLGDVPILGNLFRYEHREKDKTNLFIFLTPYVISSPEELTRIMQEHRRLAQKLLEMKEGKKPSPEELKRWLGSIDATKAPPVR